VVPFPGRKRGTVSTRPKHRRDWYKSLGEVFGAPIPSDSSLKGKARQESSGLYSRVVSYAAFFFPAFTFTHRAF